MAKLIIFDSDSRREAPLKDHNKIGRLPPPHNDVQILDKIVSKGHAMIDFDSAKGFIFQDLHRFSSRERSASALQHRQPDRAVPQERLQFSTGEFLSDFNFPFFQDNSR